MVATRSSPVAEQLTARRCSPSRGDSTRSPTSRSISTTSPRATATCSSVTASASPDAGCVSRLDVDQAVERARRSIDNDSTVDGHGPVALGVVPFRPGLARRRSVVGRVRRAQVARTSADDHRRRVRSPADAGARLDEAVRWIADRSPAHGRSDDGVELHHRARRRHRALPGGGGSRPRRDAVGRSGQGRDRPSDRRHRRPADRRPRRAPTTPRHVRFELPLLDRRVHRRVPGTARRSGRSGRAIASAGRDRTDGPATSTTTPGSPPS